MAKIETLAKNRRSSINAKVFIGKADTAAPQDATKGSEWSELTNVSDIPDLGGNPEQIDVTAIGDRFRKYIDGILEVDELEFTCFYEADAFEAVKEFGEGHIIVSLYTGHRDETQTHEVSVALSGKISAAITGFGVGDAINYTMKIAVTEVKVLADNPATAVQA